LDKTFRPFGNQKVPVLGEIGENSGTFSLKIR
jgi:hypothetical protein